MSILDLVLKPFGRRFAFAVFLISFGGFGIPSARAAAITWNGTTNSLWGDSTSWVGGVVPTSSDTLTILGPSNVAGALTINVNTAASASSINITDTSAVSMTNTTSGADQTLTIGAGGLTVGTGAVTIGSSTANQAINVALGASQTWNIGSGGLTVNNIISGTGYSMTKNGTGTLTLNGTNTYSGGTTLNAGTLAIGNNSSLGSGNVTFNGGNIIGLNGGNVTVSNNITLSANASWGSSTPTYTMTWNGVISGSKNLELTASTGVANKNIHYLNGNNTFTGIFTMGRGATVYANRIADAGVASSLGAGSALNLSTGGQTSTLYYTGTTAASTNRTIAIAGPLVIYSNNASLTLSGSISSSGANGLSLQGTAGGGSNYNEVSGVYSGTSTLTISSGATNDVWKISGNNTYTGTTTVTNSATLIAAHSNALGGTGNGTTVSINGQLLLSGGIAVGAEALTLNSGASGSWNGQTGAALRSYSGDNSWAGAITLSQATTIATNAGSNLTLSGGITGAAKNLTINSTGDTIISGNITTTTGTVTKSGTGTLTISSSGNTYNGSTTISAGTLLVTGNTSASAHTVSSGGVLGGSGVVGATTVNGILQGTLTTAGLTVNSGGVVSPNGTGSVGTLNASTITINGGSGYNFTIANVNTSVAGTDYDQIVGSGALTFNNTSLSPFTVYLYGSPTGWSNTGSYTWNIMSGSSISGFSAAAFQVVVDSTFVGDRTGGSFTFGTSGGNLTLSYAVIGDSIWSGGTGSFASGFSPVPQDGSSLIFTGAGGTATNNMTTGNLSSVASITFNSTAGSYTLAADSGSSGYNATSSLIVTGSITNNSTNAQTINTALSFGANRTVNTASGNITIGGVVAGAGGLIKSGTSTLTLNATNTFTGAVVINAGTLATGTAGLLADTANVTVNMGGTYQVGASDTINTLSGAGNAVFNAQLVLNNGGNFSGNLAGSSQLNLAGGTLTLSGNNSARSGTLVVYNGATLAVGGDAALTSGTLAGSNTNFSVRSFDATDRIVGSAFVITNGAAPTYIFGSAGTGNLTFSSIANITNQVNANRTLQVDNAWTQFNGGFVSSASYTKTGTGTLILAGNNTYTGTTTISAGTLEIGSSGRLGGGSYAANITNNSAFIYSGTNNQTLSGIISGTGAITKNGSGTLTLSGANNYSGGTTLNAGTLVIGNTAAAGSGSITQTSGSSLLKIDTTGTITNDMIVHNVLASQSATLSGAITVNNATWDIDTGDTLTISGVVSGNGGVTKNGTGKLLLSGSNTYDEATVINAGTLEAANANALGSNNTVQVNGGTLLVTVDNAIYGKNIDLGGSGVGLKFEGNYSGAVGSLTLSANSSIDLGEGSVEILFQGLALNSWFLNIYNWSGTTLSGGGTGADIDKVFLLPAIDPEDLNKISFYSGSANDSFLGTGFDLGLEATGFTPAFGRQIIPVPETETYATGLLLLLGGAMWMRRNRKPESLNLVATALCCRAELTADHPTKTNQKPTKPKNENHKITPRSRPRGGFSKLCIGPRFQSLLGRRCRRF